MSSRLLPRAPIRYPGSSINSYTHGDRFMLFTKLHRYVVVVALAGCASSAAPVNHGTITTLSAASTTSYEKCQRRVPKEVCTRCNPELMLKFKAAKDWCPEHELPESQCFECHHDLTFEPLPVVPSGADIVELSEEGEDVDSLEQYAVKAKLRFSTSTLYGAPPAARSTRTCLRSLGSVRTWLFAS